MSLDALMHDHPPKTVKMNSVFTTAACSLLLLGCTDVSPTSPLSERSPRAFEPSFDALVTSISNERMGFDGVAYVVADPTKQNIELGVRHGDAHRRLEAISKQLKMGKQLIVQRLNY